MEKNELNKEELSNAVDFEQLYAGLKYCILELHYKGKKDNYDNEKYTHELFKILTQFRWFLDFKGVTCILKNEPNFSENIELDAKMVGGTWSSLYEIYKQHKDIYPDEVSMVLRDLWLMNRGKEYHEKIVDLYMEKYEKKKP